MCVSKVSLKLIQESRRSYQLCSSDSAGSCCAHMSLCRSCFKRAHDSDWLQLCLRLKCSWLDRVAFSFLLFALICNVKAPTTDVDAEGGCDWVDTSKMDWCSVWSRTKCLRNQSGSTKLFPTFLWIFFFFFVFHCLGLSSTLISSKCNSRFGFALFLLAGCSLFMGVITHWHGSLNVS